MDKLCKSGEEAPSKVPTPSTDKLTIEEIEQWLKQYGYQEKGKFSREGILKQLADTMRENERLRDALKWLKISPTQAAFDNIKTVLKPYKHSDKYLHHASYCGLPHDHPGECAATFTRDIQSSKTS